MNEFWETTLKKTVWTMAEAALGVIGGATYFNQVNWELCLSATVLAGIITILKCMAFDRPEPAKEETVEEQEEEALDAQEEDEDDDLE